LQTVLLIYNPRAGKGQFALHLSETVDLFVKAGYAVEVHPTQERGDATDYIAHADRSWDMIVVAGGDGTLDEAVSGLMQSGRDIPIGYIPVGSTNDYASSLGLSSEPLTAIADILGGEEVALDVGQFNDRYFIYVAAFGIFTEVAYTTDQNMKNALGHFAYIMQATRQLGDLKVYPMRVAVDGETAEGEYIFGMVTNSFSVGGMKNVLFRERDVNLSDGLFEVMLIRTPRTLIEFQEILTAILTKNYDSGMIDIYKTDSLVFESDEDIPWTLDGEFGGSGKHFAVKDLHKGIRFILKKTEPEKAKTKAAKAKGTKADKERSVHGNEEPDDQ